MVKAKKLRSGSTDTADTRVRKACDLCRMKRLACKGGIPCRRCNDADDVCVFSQSSIDSSTTNLPKKYLQGLRGENLYLRKCVRVLTVQILARGDEPQPSTHDILLSIGLWKPGKSHPTLDTQLTSSESESYLEIPTSFEESQGPNFTHGDGRTQQKPTSVPQYDYTSSTPSTRSTGYTHFEQIPNQNMRNLHGPSTQAASHDGAGFSFQSEMSSQLSPQVLFGQNEPYSDVSMRATTDAATGQELAYSFEPQLQNVVFGSL